MMLFHRLHKIMSQIDDGNKLLTPISEHDRSQGSIDAPVILVQYGDYQSLACREVYRMIRSIQHQTKLCFVFRHFPQVTIHPQSQKAAEASEAAASQNKFWQMHDLLFDRQDALNNGHLLEYANSIGLDIDRFLQEMSDRIHTDRIAKSVQGGIQSGVSCAPALFINQVRYPDAWAKERLLAAIALYEF